MACCLTAPRHYLNQCWFIINHYDDVIMTTIASQITSLTSVYSTVYSEADQRKHQSSASLAFVWGIHRDRWIPRTKGQLRGKCFHLMTSSWRSCNIHLTPVSLEDLKIHVLISQTRLNITFFAVSRFRWILWCRLLRACGVIGRHLTNGFLSLWTDIK